MAQMARLDIIMQGSSFRTNLATLGICTIALIRGKDNILVDRLFICSRKRIFLSARTFSGAGL